jgi:RNA polymerase sigma-70 factor (ECF subfamily)
MSHSIPSDATLIHEHLSGNSMAMLELWMRYDGLVYGLAHSATCRRDAAEDIRQEVFLKVYSQLAQLRDPEKFGRWLCSITHNTCQSWLREQRKATPFHLLREGDHPKASFEGEVERRELRTLLRQMIDRLPYEYRSVIELHYFGGHPVAQIASFLELSETTVKWRLHKGRETLQRQATLNGYLE